MIRAFFQVFDLESVEEIVKVPNFYVSLKMMD